MQVNEIKAGLKFAVDNDLSKREIAVILLLLEQPQTCSYISGQLGKSETNIHNVLFQLRNLELVEFKDKTSDGRIIYGVIQK